MNGTELERIHQQAEGVIDTAIAKNNAAESEALNDFIFLLGGLNAISTIATNLNAALIVNMQRIRDEKLYLAAGSPRFEIFCDTHPRSPMKYKKFNYIEGIFKNVGSPLLFDLLNESELSLRQQKLIRKGDVYLEGDKMIVRHGNESLTLDVANKPGWTDALVAVAEANAELKRKGERDAKEKAELKATIERGQAEVAEKQRAIDSMLTGDPYNEAFSHAINGLLLLTEQIGHLHDAEKTKRGPDAIETLWSVMLQVRKSYGVNFAFRESGSPPALGGVAAASADGVVLSRNNGTTGGLPNSVIDAVLSKDDNWGDEEEV